MCVKGVDFVAKSPLYIQLSTCSVHVPVPGIKWARKGVMCLNGLVMSGSAARLGGSLRSWERVRCGEECEREGAAQTRQHPSRRGETN